LGRAAIEGKTHGVHFSTMGRYEGARKRLELLPEEALYLLDRGTVECWTEQGVPMSVQQGFAEMIGTEDLTLERYQV
jgi:tRNA-splicing endonuclease subunit Sen54